MSNIPSFLNRESIGTIRNGDEILGTGFVIMGGNTIVTCNHVIKNQNNLSFVSVGSTSPIPLRIKEIFEDKDIATLSISDEILLKGYNLASSPANVLQRVCYVGYDARISNNSTTNFVVDWTNIDRTGEMNLGYGVVPFIEFPAEVFNGFSGGPVFNENGEIVGVLAKTYFMAPFNKPGIQPIQVADCIVISFLRKD